MLLIYIWCQMPVYWKEVSPRLYSLACLQRGHAQASISVLRESLGLYGVRNVLPPLARIAAILDARGHRLPAWSFSPACGRSARDETF